MAVGGVSHPAHTIPLAAPRPGYPAPISNLNTSDHPQTGQVPQALRVTRPQADTGGLRIPPPIYQTVVPRPSVPSVPHPLQPPMTPITPVFARPSKFPPSADVKFSDPIIRGNSEDNLLPKRGERGDDFWRRFSMVAKEEKKTSSWLMKTESRNSRLTLWVWVIGLFILLGAGAGVGLWWYISHTTPSHQQPVAVGGSADETAGLSPSTAAGQGASSSPHVTPTYTLRRRAIPDPTPTVLSDIYLPAEDAVQLNFSGHSKKHGLHNF